MTTLKAPFPYFGGKSAIAPAIWDAFGDDVNHYIEPFFGSGATLLARPGFTGTVPTWTETVNDLDCFVANFFRAVQTVPDTVAKHCDHPVNECDLIAWHKYLVTDARKANLERLCKADPAYFDPIIAGRWAWGLAQWIGTGWCEGTYHQPDDPRNHGRGLHKKRPHLGDAGHGLHKKRPHLSNAGHGLHSQSPIHHWLQSLSTRLRRVRITCGNWDRITTPAVLSATSPPIAILLDPPYATEESRDPRLYRCESSTIAHDALDFCQSNTNNLNIRIAICGYSNGIHDTLESSGWFTLHWKTQGGLANQSKSPSRGKSNRHRETIWLSPSCNKPSLF